MQCWCGGTKAKPSKHGVSNKCNKDCPGKSRIKKCGGSYAASVFQYEGSPKGIPRNTNYVGCFVDSLSDRALSLKSTSDSSGMDYMVRSFDPFDPLTDHIMAVSRAAVGPHFQLPLYLV